MKFEKLFYVILSSIVITAIILVGYLFPPIGAENSVSSMAKKIYFVDHISTAHQAVIKRFNEKYVGQIEVEAINLPFDKFSTNERKELLARYLRSKSDRIDIFSVDQIWVPRFAKWGIPLEKYINQEQKENLLPYAMESCYYNDTLIAVPLYIDIALMFYRDDYIRSLPDYKDIQNKLSNSISWEDFIDLNKRLGKIDRPFFLFQADDFEGLICIFSEMMAGLNKSMVENGVLQLQTPEAKKALQLLVDMVNKYDVSPKVVTQFKENPSYDYYIKTNGAFLRGWTSFLKANRGVIDSAVFNNIKMVPTPSFKNGKSVSVFGGWNLVISKYSTKVPEAVKFLNFVISEEAQKIMYKEGAYLPINLSLYHDAVFLKEESEFAFYEQLLKTGFHRPFLEDYTNIADILSYYLNLAIKQEISVDYALKEATKKIKSQTPLLK